MKKSLFTAFSVVSLIIMTLCNSPRKPIIPGDIWYDTDQHPINAHGGGILYYGGTYYWFGEYKKGETWKLKKIQNWECFRCDAGGVSCYSSKNLTDWKFEGIALKPETRDSSSDLYIGKVIERPKVIYNEKAKKFVMWMHIDSEDYSYARAGVAISDNPTGPYKYLGSMRPNNAMSRDMTLFKDDDGKAYLIFSSENNAVMHISLLTGNYLKPSGIEKRIFINESREAPAMFKHKKVYYLITSACTGWAPNTAMLAEADSIMGEWKMLYNPCKGPDSDLTFHAQSTFVLSLPGKPGEYIFMADRWNKTNLEDSRYIWLPLVFNGDSCEIEWRNSWTLIPE